MNLDPILSLNHRFHQVVKQPTRIDPKTGKESLLDPVITSLSTYYQEPICLEPLDADINKKGKKSDHKIVVMSPINETNNIPARDIRHVMFRPHNEAQISKLIDWLITEDWSCVYSVKSTHEMAKNFQTKFSDKYIECFPEKNLKLSNEDQPWVTEKIKKIDRQRKRAYAKARRSEKWKRLNKIFKKEVKKAKQNFYKNFIEDLKIKKNHQNGTQA